MKKVNAKLLQSFRDKARCEHCRCKGPVQPHHLARRGLGGGSRLDVPINLVALCNVCHTMVHEGNILRSTILAIVAVREGMTSQAVQEELWRLTRLPKGSELP